MRVDPVRAALHAAIAIGLGVLPVHAADQVDIGGGRQIHVDCRGEGAPTVVLVSGLRGSADDWSETDPARSPDQLDVFSAVAAFTRVCAYDRPGTPVGEAPSRSDPVRQPTTAADAVADLRGLMSAAGIATPAVFVGHSYGGLIVRLYASRYPDEVSGLVLVDALTEGLRDAQTAAEWAIQRRLINGDLSAVLPLYPDLEQLDPDRSFDQLRAAAPLRPMPLVVLSADEPIGPLLPDLIAQGVLPADVPPDFGNVVDRAQRQAQARLAQLVPDALHITHTRSGHNIHKQQPTLVVSMIRQVVEAVRETAASPRR